MTSIIKPVMRQQHPVPSLSSPQFLNPILLKKKNRTEENVADEIRHSTAVVLIWTIYSTFFLGVADTGIQITKSLIITIRSGVSPGSSVSLVLSGVDTEHVDQVTRIQLRTSTTTVAALYLLLFLHLYSQVLTQNYGDPSPSVVY